MTPLGYVGVVGPGEATQAQYEAAREVGRLLAARGAVVVTGGLGGVMEAASRGAAEAGGLTVGLLPGGDRSGANPHLAVAVPTGMGEMRNALIVRCCEVLIAVGGGWGTLSELALARRAGRPVYALDSWGLGDDGPEPVASPAQAVDRAMSHLPLRG